MLARNQMYLEEEVVATGNIPPIVHYLLSGFIVMMMLSLILVMQIVEPLNQQEMIMRYKVAKVKGSCILFQKWMSLMLFNLVLGGISLGALALCVHLSNSSLEQYIQWHLSTESLLGGILVAASLAAVGLLIGMILKGKESYSLFIYLIALIQAFLSGGIVPSAFLPDAINGLGYFTYNKYAVYILGHLLGVEVQIKYYLGASMILIGCLIGCGAIIRKRGIRL